MKVGILGGGQLGRMLTLAGYPLGITCSCYDDTPNVSASFTGHVEAGSVTEIKRIDAWVKHQDVITYEWENFPTELVGHIAALRPLHPSVKALVAAQDRWHEKVLFDELDIPVPAFRFASDEAELRTAIDELGCPLVVKTKTGGYDGKGQAVVRSDDDIPAALALLNHSPVIAEAFVDFQSEVSAIGVRARDGDIKVYPLTHNTHVDGILRRSVAPAVVPAEFEQAAQRHLGAIMKKLDYVGVLALEMFVTPGGLLANEMAPRVHNSGHWTQNGATTSQFENHLRAVTGMPLGSTEPLCPTAMVNLIGFIPPIDRVLAVPGTHVHLYDKEVRPGRKVGHINVTAPTTTELMERVAAVERLASQP
jgi:5-(carboxyamino)imidazole ribonucleotide synthase